MPYSTLMPVFAGKVLQTSAQPVVALLCEGAHPVMRCRAPQALPLGLLLTTVGVGALVGALAVASLPERARRGRWLTAGNLAFPALLLAFSASRSFVVSLALLFGVGISFVMQNALANTLLQIITPDAVRGRVMSIYTLTFQASMRLGGLQAGLAADCDRRAVGGGHWRGGVAGVWVVCGSQIPEGEGDAVSTARGSRGAEEDNMTGKRKTPIVPTYKGKPVQALMSVEKGEEIAGTWTTPVVPEIGFYKLLAKRRTDGVCEWVHFVQRADGQ